MYLYILCAIKNIINKYAKNVLFIIYYRGKKEIMMGERKNKMCNMFFFIDKIKQ